MSDGLEEVLEEATEINQSGVSAASTSAKKAYIVMGVAAAAVSAATAAYVLWSRQKAINVASVQAESVQQLLDRCHDQVRSIEQRLGEIKPPSVSA